MNIKSELNLGSRSESVIDTISAVEVRTANRRICDTYFEIINNEPLNRYSYDEHKYIWLKNLITICRIRNLKLREKVKTIQDIFGIEDADIDAMIDSCQKSMGSRNKCKKLTDCYFVFTWYLRNVDLNKSGANTFNLDLNELRCLCFRLSRLIKDSFSGSVHLKNNTYFKKLWSNTNMKSTFDRRRLLQMLNLLMEHNLICRRRTTRGYIYWLGSNNPFGEKKGK